MCPWNIVCSRVSALTLNIDLTPFYLVPLNLKPSHPPPPKKKKKQPLNLSDLPFMSNLPQNFAELDCLPA